MSRIGSRNRRADGDLTRIAGWPGVFVWAKEHRTGLHQWPAYTLFCAWRRSERRPRRAAGSDRNADDSDAAAVASAAGSPQSDSLCRATGKHQLLTRNIVVRRSFVQLAKYNLSEL